MPAKKITTRTPEQIGEQKAIEKILEISEMSIFEKLQSLQMKLASPKGQKNEFSNFNYRNIEDIISAVKPLLIEMRLLLTFTDEFKQIGNEVYCVSKATITNLDDSQEFIESTGYAREESTRPKFSVSQLSGSASTYARRYSIQGLLICDANTDPDEMNNDHIGVQSIKTNEADEALHSKKIEASPAEVADYEKKYQALKHKGVSQSPIHISVSDQLFAISEGNNIDAKEFSDWINKEFGDLNAMSDQQVLDVLTRVQGIYSTTPA